MFSQSLNEVVDDGSDSGGSLPRFFVDDMYWNGRWLEILKDDLQFA